jgi:ABC-type xylose transport system permease subunit
MQKEIEWLKNLLKKVFTDRSNVFVSLRIYLLTLLIVGLTTFIYSYNRDSKTPFFLISPAYGYLVEPLILISTIISILILLFNKYFKLNFIISIQILILIVVTWLFINGFFRKE